MFDCFKASAISTPCLLSIRRLRCLRLFWQKKRIQRWCVLPIFCMLISVNTTLPMSIGKNPISTICLIVFKASAISAPCLLPIRRLRRLRLLWQQMLPKCNRAGAGLNNQWLITSCTSAS